MGDPLHPHESYTVQVMALGSAPRTARKMSGQRREPRGAAAQVRAGRTRRGHRGFRGVRRSAKVWDLLRRCSWYSQFSVRILQKSQGEGVILILRDGESHSGTQDLWKNVYFHFMKEVQCTNDIHHID